MVSSSDLIAYLGLSQMVRGARASKRDINKVIGGTATHRREDLDYLRAPVEAGKIKSLDDRGSPLARAAEAHRHVEAGGKKGNVGITVAQDSSA